jgi:hypothetical protein
MLRLMTRIATILIAAGALLVPVSPAGADTLPKDAVKCTYKVPKSYPLSSMTRKGLPVSVTCEGDATVSSLVDMTGKLDQDWDDAHNHNIPGIALPEDTKVRAGVAAVTHVKITKAAAKFLRRNHRPQLRVLLGELMPDGYYQSVDSGKRVVLR